MTAWRLILGLHIATGAIGLVLGPVAMWAAKRPRGLHTRTSAAYHWVMLTLCLSAAGLAFLDWKRIRWFLPIAAGSYAFALLGYVAAKWRWRGWLTAHVSDQGGSYIAMITALLVVNWRTLTGHAGVESVWPWILPTLIGTPIISWVNYQIARGRRPR